jgi:2-oxoglutarate ferredoxin oxidoreductase subunit alpha
MTRVYTVRVGGKAGEGVKKAAQVIAATLFGKGWQVFQADDYQSLIKGGHNFSTVSFAAEPVYNSYNKADLLISFDKRSYETHQLELYDESSLHVYNSDELSPIEQHTQTACFGLPLSRLMKEIYSAPANVSLAAVAIFYLWMNYPENDLETVIRREFKRNVEENVHYAREIYRLADSQNLCRCNACPNQITLEKREGQRFYSGNQAIAIGAWMGGLDFYYAYPMTPASSILHYLALKQSSHQVFAIHAESELAAANMAIGSVVAGARTAVGSSGGGFALMQEAFSLAGITEAPLLCILASRPGPATGVSTYTAQEDLFFALHQGHGEFGRVVAAPDSAERATSLAAELLSLAWEFQSPVILLTDKHLSECSQNFSLPADLPFAEALMGEASAEYQRYEPSLNGVSPLLFPGSDNVSDATVIKWNSHEHLPSGLRTDKAEPIVAMKDKRNRKSDALAVATGFYRRIEIYGGEGTPVFAYGSAVLELREAQKHCAKQFTIVALIYLLPFPDKELEAYKGQEVIILEHSSTGNLERYLSQNMELRLKKSILRYDGRAFDPIELAGLLEEVL